MRNISVVDLTEAIRVRSDIQNSQICTDSELLRFINSAYCEMYDLIVSKYENYFTKSYSFPITSAADMYTVPADFYKLLKVERLRSGQSASDPGARFSPIFPINFQETGRRQSTYWPTIDNTRYILQNDQVRFDPPSDFICRIWYVPAPEFLTSDSTINCRAGWEEFLIVACSAMVKQKQELDAMGFLNDKAAQMARILRMAQNYDAGLPKTIIDIEAMYSSPYFER